MRSFGLAPEARSVYLRMAFSFVVSLLVLTPIIAALMPNTSWHRVATRCFMILLAATFTWSAGHPRLWAQKIRALGLNGPHRLRSVGIGVVIASFLTVGLVGVELLFDGRDPPTISPRRSLVADIGIALLAAVVISYIEEVLCRGYLKTTLGGPMSAFLYSAVHLVRPIHGTDPANGFEPFIAIKRFPQLFEAFGVLHNATFGILSLFFFGMALNKLRDRTGKLYVGIGVHIGVVIVLKLSYRVVEELPNGHNYLVWGSRRLHDGLVGTVLMALFFLWAAKGKVPFEETPRLPET